MDLWLFWEIIVNCATFSAEAYLLYRRLGVDPNKRKRLYIGIVLITAIISIVNHLDIQMMFLLAPGFPIYLTRLITTGLLLAYAFFVFRGTASLKIMWCFVILFIIAVSDLAALVPVAAVSQTDVASVSAFGPERFWVTIIHLCIVVTTCLLLAQPSRDKKRPALHIPVYVRLVLMVILSMGTMSVDILIDNILIPTTPWNILHAGELFISLTLLTVIFSAFILVTRVGVLANENIEYQLELRHNKLEREYFKYLEVAMQELQEFKHNIYNHSLTMRGLLANKDYPALSQHFEDFNGDVCQKAEVILTHNRALNSLLYNKMLVMRSGKINFQHQIYESKNLPFHTYELCSIIGNLLDNAIEACLKLPDEDSRFIRLDITRKAYMLIIHVENSYNGQYIKTGENYISHKTGEGHGIGLRHVRRVVTEHGGHLQIRPTTSTFSVVVFLPCITNDNGRKGCEHEGSNC